MLKLTDYFLNKFRLIDAMVVCAVLLFVLQLIQLYAAIRFDNNYNMDAKMMVSSYLLPAIPALYKPALLIAAAKIISLLEEKKNAAN